MRKFDHGGKVKSTSREQRDKKGQREREIEG
jgi:hypothetical protein